MLTLSKIIRQSWSQISTVDQLITSFLREVSQKPAECSLVRHLYAPETKRTKSSGQTRTSKDLSSMFKLQWMIKERINLSQATKPWVNRPLKQVWILKCLAKRLFCLELLMVWIPLTIDKVATRRMISQSWIKRKILFRTCNRQLPFQK